MQRNTVMRKVTHAVIFIGSLILFGGCGKGDSESGSTNTSPPKQESSAPEETAELKKTREFMKAGMYQRAVGLLESEIEKTPANAEIHVLVGQCYLATGKINQAQESFLRATRLDSEKEKLIGKACFDVGKDAFQQGDEGRATELFRLAVKYDNSLNGSVAGFFCERAIAKLKQGQVKAAGNLVTLAESYDSKAVGRLVLDVAQVAFEEGKALFEQGKREKAKDLLGLSAKYDESKKPPIGELYSKAAIARLERGELDSSTALARVAVSYSPELATPISERGVELSTKVGKPATSWSKIVALVTFVETVAPARGYECGELLWLLILKHEAPPAAEDMLRIGTKACKLNADVKGQVVEMYLKLASEAIAGQDLREDRALSLLRGAVELDSKAGVPAATTALEELSRRAGKPQFIDKEWSRMRNVINAVTPFVSADSSDRGKAGELLFQLLIKAGPLATAQDTDRYCVQAFRWNRELRKPVTERLLKKAQELLRTDPIQAAGISNAGTLVHRAVEVSPESRDSAAVVVLEEITRRSANLSKIGEERFFNLFEICEALKVSPETVATPPYQFANALKLYAKDVFETAIPILRNLSTKFVSTNEGKKASEILAPPALGKRVVAHDEPPKSKAFGLQLRTVEVRENQIELAFRLYNNSDKPQGFVYAPKMWESKKYGITGEGIYIEDSLGVKHFALGGFIGKGLKQTGYRQTGGVSDNLSEQLQVIWVPASDRVQASVVFPLISAGASSFRFVRPFAGRKGGFVYGFSCADRWEAGPWSVKLGPFEKPE